ncbi:MAG: aminopeptidase, partial [Candidatus Thermoplasmatota archaeon]|nr:aminopeptidase [Candidatus Thermoplasmatota archaeon]
MDPRVTEHAEIIASWSTDLKQGDTVLIDVQEGGEPLAKALVAEAAKRGAQPLTLLHQDGAGRAFLLNAQEETIRTPPAHMSALAEATDVFIFIRAGSNTRSNSDVPREKQQARSKAMEEIRETRLAKRWCLTMHPTPSLAQEAGMSTEAFQELYYGMTLIDWPSFAKEVERVADRFEGVKEVHLVAPDTDLYLPVSDRPWVASI